ncbi:ATPase [Echinicola soli]|uniref:ATPase n=1 Tax=Echinicola soli TaxID=2591634 RepID=A0A514CFU9_9BACT|nr:SRPBCC domain-containing protein [Echinicola soli]QDH78630.1 ATPase [Echinicola soli]
MELKTKVHAEDGKQEILITREFDLPLDLLFKAYMEPEIVEQWMGTKVLKLENKTHGSYHFETTDPKGNKHGFHGTVHDVVMNKKITRTFEMENADFGAQLEFLEFESLNEDTSKLSMHVIYRSVAIRDQILQLPFVQGINMAHDRLEEIQKSIK